ncbi:hypothetical protein N2W54_002961 [Lotmaria passim]
MMSKAAFMMQDHLRRNYVMITDISNPTTFFVRGRLPFPQGLMAIAVLFKNKRPADVYAHPYFIEKQSDPSQPSPQLHLTEESQGIMKVISGLRYMRDDNTKLDSTMVFVTDYKVEVEARMPRVPADAAEPHYGSGVAPASSHTDASGEQPKATLSLEQRAMLRRNVHHVQQVPGGGGDAGLGLAGTRSPLGSSAGGASFNTKADGPARPASASTTTTTATAAASGEQSVIPGYSTFPTPEECAADPWVVYRFLKAAVFGRRALQEEEEHSPAHRLNVPALFERRRGGYTVLYNPIEVNEKTFVELIAKLQREERVVATIVVPTRPAWRQLQVWADVFPDATLLCSGDVPLIPSCGAASSRNPLSSSLGTSLGESRAATAGDATGSNTLAENKNDKEQSQNSSGGSSSNSNAGEQTRAAESAAWRGGCQDLGNGMTGLSFPEVDLEAEAAAERQRVEEATTRARATAEAARCEREQERQQQHRYQQSPQHEPASSALEKLEEEEEARWAEQQRRGEQDEPSAKAPFAAQRRRQEEKIRLRKELAEEEARLRARSAGNSSTSASAAATQTETSAGGDGEGDLVDVLWHDVSFFTEKVQQPVGLRESDAHRLRILSPRSTTATTSPPATAAAASSNAKAVRTGVDSVQLTPTIELLRIAGDAVTEEYVLYDANSSTLACTDLYHGAYADLDPANSWMCRVWFKFMKRGNYKRSDLVPRYKWLQVLQQRSLSTLQNTVEELTRRRPIRFLLFAHGTPPLQREGVNSLRQQWSLPPLHPAEMPHDPRRRQ